METKKIMLYSTEDKRMGFKPVKFNFAEGAKICNKETGKIMICEGVYEIPEFYMPDLHRVFKKLSRSNCPAVLKINDLCNFARTLANGYLDDIKAREYDINSTIICYK